MNNVITIILYVVLVLSVVGGIGAVAYFTAGFTTDFQTFYLKSDDGNILESIDGVELEDEKTYTFEVKYTFGKLAKQNTGYSVKIIPNAEKADFAFRVKGEDHTYSELEDLTNCFEISHDTASFTILGNVRLKDVLERYYGESVEIVDPIVELNDYYTLIVTSYNNKASVKVNFHGSDATGTMRIDPDPIEF